MADKTENNPSDTKAPVASGTPATKTRIAGQPRTVTFTIPNMPRPKAPSVSPAQRLGIGALALIIGLSALIGGISGALIDRQHSQNGLFENLTSEKKVVTNQSQLISQIAKNVGPSVVSVNVSITEAAPTDSLSQLFGGSSSPKTAQAAGTGIIISNKGLVVTNRHVVPAGTTKVSVTLSDGTELKDVKVIGRTADSDSLDIAFLQINDAKGRTLQPATIGDSAKSQVGDDVVAIGNALGQFQNTVTSGIVSGFGRSVQAGDSGDQSSMAENLDNLIQTDAAINPGNSGGPLVNLNGQVIGINTAVAGGTAQNIGFAIPINDVRGLIHQVLRSGSFERPYLGVRYVPLTADIAEQAKLKVSNGAYIVPASQGASSSVLAGGPADSAGLKEGDVIVQVDATKLDDKHSLTSQLVQHKPGDKVSLKIQRGDDSMDVEVTLGTLPSANQ